MTATRFLIQMSGAPGSGKSTVSTHLSQHPLLSHLQFINLDHDILKTFLLDSEHDFVLSGRLAYRLQWVLTESFLKQGKSVIVDCPCNFQHILANGTELAGKYGVEYKYLECAMMVEDLGVLDERLRARDGLRSMRTGVYEPPRDSEAKAKSRQEVEGVFRKWIEEPCRPENVAMEGRGGTGAYLAVRTSEESLEVCVERVVRWILESESEIEQRET